MADVVLKQLKKSFGSVDVIHSVDLDIESGDFVVFVGPSGCGKSTLLRLVAGLEEATAGQLFIGDADVTYVDPAERGVAMVFQSYALYPHMTVRENMGFGLKMTGHEKSAIDERVGKASKILHLDPLLDRKPKQLSGGQRQRVAIGRSIVREPKVFLFDEPLSNLDAELRVQMRLEIAKLHADLGATMIYVTHDQVEAMTLADKIVVLRDGRVEQYGSPLELYGNPDNAFVGGFIGSPKMNHLSGIVASYTKGNANVVLDNYEGAKAAVPVATKLTKGQKVLLGIRPEHFDAQGSAKLKVKIDVIEDLGGSSFAYAGGNSENPLTIQLPEGHKNAEGKATTVSFDPTRAFLFDAETDLRIS